MMIAGKNLLIMLLLYIRITIIETDVRRETHIVIIMYIQTFIILKLKKKKKKRKKKSFVIS